MLAIEYIRTQLYTDTFLCPCCGRNAHTFSLNLTRLIQTVDTCFLPSQHWDSHRMPTSLMWISRFHSVLTVYCYRPILFDSISMFQALYSTPHKINVWTQLQTILASHELWRKRFWLSNIKMSDFWVFLWI